MKLINLLNHNKFFFKCRNADYLKLAYHEEHFTPVFIRYR